MVAEIQPQVLDAMLKAGSPVVLIDVRQPEENEFVALPNSQFIPLGELPVRTAEIDPPAGALVVVYCHHGIRSRKGAAFLEASGISPVASLTGGIDAWSQLVDPTMPRY
ncbi:MAG: rhodanese-like domain-containing protein [Gemmataceae bacterium]